MTDAQRKEAEAALGVLTELSKSLAGEPVEAKEKNPLRKGLDAVLETMSGLIKGKKKAEKSEEGDEDETEEEKEEREAKEAEAAEEAEEAKKSLTEANDISKSLADADPDFVQAYESSELVKGLCDAIQAQNIAIDALTERIESIAVMQSAFVKSFVEVSKAEGSLMKSMHETIEKIGGQPVGRKSIDPKELMPLEKAFIDNEKINGGNRPDDSGKVPFSEKLDIIQKSIESGNKHGISLPAVAGFESFGRIDANIKKCLEEAKAL